MDTFEADFGPREPKPTEPPMPTGEEDQEDGPADDPDSDLTIGRGTGEDPPTEEPLAWDYDDKHKAT